MLFILLINIIVLYLVFKLPKTLLVDLRQVYTTNKVDEMIFLLPPSRLSDIGFKKEDKLLINNFYNKNHNFLLINKYLYNDSISIFLKSKLIALSYSKYGGNGCGYYNEDLINKINWVAKGGGCCSDHSMVFISLSLLNGINSREVSNMNHTFNEFWDPKKCKWIFIDTEYLVMAQDSSGNYLSTLEIFQAKNNGSKVILDFFGPTNESAKAVALRYFNPNSFQSLIFNMGNAVFTEEYWNKSLFFFPKEVRQFIFIISGVQKGYNIIGKDSNYILNLEKRKSRYDFIIGIWFFFNLLVLFIWRFTNKKL